MTVTRLLPLMLMLLATSLPARGEPAKLTTAPPSGPDAVATSDAAAMSTFLDRLMRAESNGNDFAANPRSTAVGAFQFVEGTFLEVAARHFAAETAGLTPAQILAKRTDRAFARKAAEAYTRSNAGHLAAAGITPTFTHLRLAYLVGPSAAVRVVRMPPQTPAALVLGPAAIRANPFLARYTTSDLVARAAREVGPVAAAAATPGPTGSARGKPGAGHAVTPDCNLAQPSCRRWLALAQRRVARGQRVGAR